MLVFKVVVQAGHGHTLSTRATWGFPMTAVFLVIQYCLRVYSLERALREDALCLGELVQHFLHHQASLVSQLSLAHGARFSLILQLLVASETESMHVLADVDRRVQDVVEAHWALQILLHFFVPRRQVFAPSCPGHCVEFDGDF